MRGLREDKLTQGSRSGASEGLRGTEGQKPEPPGGPSPRKTSLSCCLAPCSLQLRGRAGLSPFYEWQD